MYLQKWCLLNHRCYCCVFVKWKQSAKVATMPQDNCDVIKQMCRVGGDVHFPPDWTKTNAISLFQSHISKYLICTHITMKARHEQKLKLNLKLIRVEQSKHGRRDGALLYVTIYYYTWFALNQQETHPQHLKLVYMKWFIRRRRSFVQSQTIKTKQIKSTQNESHFIELVSSE